MKNQKERSQRKPYHPPYIIKQFPIIIETLLSNHSSNKTIFPYAAEDHEKKLKKSDYHVKLHCKSTNQIPNKINSKRNITLFNQPFSKSVSTKIGHYFLNLLDNHFSQSQKFNNIFNRNNVKVSYSCIKNIKSIITNHNKTILNESELSNKNKCN